MAGFDQRTIDFYQSNAETYLGCRPDEIEPEIPALLAKLAPQSRILELGCGGGENAEFMIAQGFDVDPTDGTPAMAAQAEARLGRPVRVMRFDALAATNEYDAVIASAALLHVPLQELAPILQRIWRALKPGGLHFASYETGAQEGRDEHDRYYNYLARDDADAHYRAAGEWESLAYDERMGVGYFSKPALWLHVVARKG